MGLGKFAWIFLVMIMGVLFSQDPALPSESQPPVELDLIPAETAWLNTHPVIRIGTMADWPPLNFLTPTGKPAGIGASYIMLLNKRLNQALTIVPGSFQENFSQVKEKKLDALMDITPKKEREPFFFFTRPYLQISHVIVGRKKGPSLKSEKDLADKILALEKGFFNITYFKKKYPRIRIREYDSTSDALEAVSRGEADAYAGNRAVVIYLMEKELITNLKIRGRMEKPPVILSIGVRKDWPELAAILDKALASLTIEEELQIRKNWMEIASGQQKAEDQSRAISFEQVAFVIKSIALVFAVIFAAVLLVWLAKGRPKKFSIRATLFGILLIFSGLTISIGVLAVLLLNLEMELTGAQARKNDYMGLAYELKQSSDDLTRFSRTFVVTGDAVYESYFQDILDIRDGVIPHPLNQTPSFWDHVSAGELKPEYKGETYSIEQKMVDLGLSEDEKRELSLAKKESDDLTILEAIAMNAVKGLFKDKSGNFSIVKTPEREMARLLLHGKKYHKAKTRIMKHIDNFIALVEKRTEKELDQARNQATAVLLTVTALTFCTVIFAFFSFFLLKRRIISPLYRLKSGAQRLEKGDYSHHINIGSQDEAQDLANAFNTMTDSIKERTSRLRSIIDTAVDAIIVISSKGIIQTFSPAAEKIFGYSAPDIIGKNVSLLMPESIANLHEGYLFRHLQTDGSPSSGKRIESLAQRKGGTTFPVGISISQATIGRERFFTGIIQDITARKEAERELKESETLHRLLAESSADMIVQYGLDGKTLYVSPACRSLTGFEPQDLIGRSVLDLAHPDHHEEIREAMAKLTNAMGMVTLTVRIKRKDGSTRWADTVCQPIADAETGKIKAILGISRDITPQKLMEDARRSSLGLNQMADKASLEEILEQGLEEGVRLTESGIGYLHFVDAERQAIEIQTWSKDVRSQCDVIGGATHCRTDKAGIWTECIEEKTPVIHNEESMVDPGTFPQGHIPVTRHLAAPILEDNRVVAILGVANKAMDYVRNDADVLSLLGENIWSIVQRKKSAAIILQNEERLQLVLKSGNLGYWDTNLKLRSTIVNQRWAELFGYRLDEIPAPYQVWKDSLHPDDRQQIMDTAKNYLTGKTPVYEIEYRIITRDRKTRWLISRGAAVEWESDGTPLRMVGTLLDITENKKIEKERRQNMEDLQRFSDIAIGREERMIDLKQEINDLLARMGQEKKYKIR